MNNQHNDQSELPISDARVEGVATTAGGLLRSTLIAALLGLALLVLVWLPAEYGVDPTGAGSLLGLTEMGEIKQQLAQEADAEAEDTPTTAVISPDIDQRLSAIEQQVAAIAAAVGAAKSSSAAVAKREDSQPVNDESTSQWRDQFSYTLAPSEGIEVKLAMQADDVATFEWQANGGVLNHDTHGNGEGERIMYERGRGVPEQTGELKAAFDGRHGWFWRNRTEAPVTLELRTGGDYERLIKP
jgi:hypothetical protein